MRLHAPNLKTRRRTSDKLCLPSENSPTKSILISTRWINWVDSNTQQTSPLALTLNISSNFSVLSVRKLMLPFQSVFYQNLSKKWSENYKPGGPAQKRQKARFCQSEWNWSQSFCHTWSMQLRKNRQGLFLSHFFDENFLHILASLLLFKGLTNIDHHWKNLQIR